MKKYNEQFKFGVLEYVHKHEELTIYECSQKFDMSYSTLCRWLRRERFDKSKELVRVQEELREAKKTLKVLKEAYELLGK